MGRIGVSVSPLQKSPFRIEPLNSAIGALIQNVDLMSIDAPTADALNTAVHQYGVLFYRRESKQSLSATEFLNLAGAFGDIERPAYRVENPPDDERISSVNLSSKASKSARTNIWHTDATPEECPPQTALLNAVILPERG